MPECMIGIDIGGTKIAVGLVDMRTGILLSQVRGLTPKGGNEKILSRVGDLTEKLMKSATKLIGGIGVGIPGRVDRKHGIALSAGNLDFQNLHIKTYLQERFGIPTYLENDTNAGAMGEMTFGWGRKYRNFVYLAVGTGIGSGLILDGKLYLGEGEGGEIGHMIVDPSKPPCYCGAPGCLESLASGTAIARQAQARLQAGESSSLGEDWMKRRIVTSEDVVRAAENGDGLALDIMRGVGRYLACGILSVSRLLDPEAVILAGGVCQSREFLWELILSGIPSDRIRRRLESLLHFSALDSAVIGAASVALEPTLTGG